MRSRCNVSINLQLDKGTFSWSCAGWRTIRILSIREMVFYDALVNFAWVQDLPDLSESSSLCHSDHNTYKSAEWLTQTSWWIDSGMEWRIGIHVTAPTTLTVYHLEGFWVIISSAVRAYLQDITNLWMQHQAYRPREWQSSWWNVRVRFDNGKEWREEVMNWEVEDGDTF